MEDVPSLAHAKWGCKYHVVWIPQCRKKMLHRESRKYLGETFRDLAMQKECTVIERHLLLNHLPVLISIPPQYSVSQLINFIKAKVPFKSPGRQVI